MLGRGNSAVLDRGYSTALNRGNSAVLGRGNSAVLGRGNSTALSRGYSTALNRGNSAVLGRGNSAALSRGNSATLNRGNSATLNRGNSAALGGGFLSHPPPWDFSPQVPLLRQICVNESKLVGFNHGIAYMCIFTKYFFLSLSRRNLNWSLVLYTKARLQRSGESFLKCILFITH